MKDQLADLLNRIPWALVVFFYGAYLGWGYYDFKNGSASPLRQKEAQIQSVENSIVTIQKKLKDAETFYKSLDAKRLQIRKLAGELGEMRLTLSEEIDVASFVRLVVTEAKRVGLRVVSVEPGKQIKQEFYAKQPYFLRFTGLFFQAVTFVNRIGNLRKIVGLEKFLLRPDPVEAKDAIDQAFVPLTGSIEIIAYRYSGSEADEIAEKAEKEGGSS